MAPSSAVRTAPASTRVGVPFEKAAPVSGSSAGDSGASAAIQPSEYRVRASRIPLGQRCSTWMGSCGRALEQLLRSKAGSTGIL